MLYPQLLLDTLLMDHASPSPNILGSAAADLDSAEVSCPRAATWTLEAELPFSWEPQEPDSLWGDCVTEGEHMSGEGSEV